VIYLCISPLNNHAPSLLRRCWASAPCMAENKQMQNIEDNAHKWICPDLWFKWQVSIRQLQHKQIISKTQITGCNDKQPAKQITDQQLWDRQPWGWLNERNTDIWEYMHEWFELACIRLLQARSSRDYRVLVLNLRSIGLGTFKSQSLMKLTTEQK